jgi:D-alanyl-D-alanine carboxypeptidase
MHHSSFAWRPGIRGRHLTEYAVFERPYALTGFDPTLFSTAGAVVSTVDDVDRFFDALLGGRLLARRLVRTMATPLTGSPLPYGLGIYSLSDPCPAADGSTRTLLGHDGASLGTLSISLSSPDARRQVTVAYTGRGYPPAATVSLDDFLVAGLLATCTTSPAADAPPALRAPRLDRRVLDRLTTVR